MKRPSISVLVISYNHENYIESALNSVSSQVTLRDVEVIIADDASTDRTLEIVEKWRCESGLRVKVLPAIRHLGITKNYERAFSACNGDYIAVLEGDDEWISCDKLELQAKFLEEHSEYVLVANRFLLHNEATGESAPRPLIGLDEFWTPISSEQLAEMNWFGTFSTCMFVAKALKAISSQVFKEVSYDWMVNLAVTEFGSAALLPEVATLYRIHSGGAWSSSRQREQDEALQELIPRYIEILGGRLIRQLGEVLSSIERRLGEEIVPTPALLKRSFERSKRDRVPLARIPRVLESKRPRVSVVMTSFNHSEYVAEAVESVLAQEMPNLELIIVDDGSSDRSAKVLSQFLDSRIRLYLLGENTGAASALNFAIQQSRGEYVAVINSDDRWEVGKLSRQLSVFAEKENIGAVFTGVRLVAENGKPLPPKRIPRWMDVFRQPNRSQGQWLRYFMSQGNALCHPSILIKREIYKEIGLYDNTLRQIPDLDKWISLVKRYPIVVLGDEALVRFRTFRNYSNASGLSESNIIRTYHEHIVVNERFFEGISSDLLYEGFSDLLRIRSVSTKLQLKCAIAFLWLDCQGPLKEINRAQALLEIRKLLRNSESKIYLQTHFGVRDSYIHELENYADGARTLDALNSLKSLRYTPERIPLNISNFQRARMTIAGMRRTPLRQWPRKIRRKLIG